MNYSLKIVLGAIAFVIVVVLLIFREDISFAITFHQKTYTREQKKIEKCIANREYDKAREVAQSIPANKSYTNNGTTHYFRREALDKINTAQLSVMIDNSQLEDAESAAREFDATHIFWKLIEKNLSRLYSNNFRSLYSLLSRYPITASFHDKLVDFYTNDFSYAQDYASTGEDHYGAKKYYYSTNVGYNDEVSKNNKLVMQVIDMAVFDNNVDCIRKMLLLLKPEAVEVSRVKSRKDEEVTKYATITYKLENKAANEVKAKAKQAGINL